ncbi:NAD(P)H dehydrogenase (quinone) [Brevibacterium iodinum ATCC 49514]|uniref:NAD(P)H dehydrogenase (Quinone) n=2 Tax=Brevibacterium iodinum TaxID=31943 RepID=A0A2H1IV48_9MICO|nr:NAD(P)H dehydrogenase (quinone) [Brevibacterium iodinum ATCC 49514]SUW14226.1 Glutathione-regulated potassium-efflux system ancillary protein kefF [Brevibacterium iodinum]
MSVLDARTLSIHDGGMEDNATESTVLWLSAHPEPRSLNGSLRTFGIEHLRTLGHNVLESDLYAMEWDPVVRPHDAGTHVSDRFRISADTRTAHLAGTQPDAIILEQEKLRRADALVVQFPLWWYGMPAILKGWFDRVFVSGFAFGTDETTGRRLRFEQGPFAGKRALVITTLGDRPLAIGPRGKSGELNELLFGLLHGTFAYTGMSVLEPFAVPSADHIDDITPTRARLIERLDELFTAPTIPFRPQFTGDYTPEWELEPHLCPNEHGVRIHTAS